MNTEELSSLNLRLDTAADVFYAAEKDFRDTVRNTIITCINEISPDKRKVVFNDYEDDVDTYVCVSYDGGNHPEYASNICSMVYEISIIGKDRIQLGIEDCDEYEEDRVPTNELHDVANILVAITENVIQNR